MGRETGHVSRPTAPRLDAWYSSLSTCVRPTRAPVPVPFVRDPPVLM
ncbi:hypothetical protein SAM23877_1039 [Streptomyces ambofaciens ATCC 23877]|uniref:Uncharacterized protein n=1 Tax=Streptomyces ambofaciens (strain ATCC 23877 / 3486 / DSM 40053 / JCM 4204 / NBRC 12836 / NRRL B-2516) TaxID=278992 RepID=A0A0K2AM71_STRA7|nr:hypothetical protein SAM23877_1039 [Streptomyces ambofaciens ATCC 23877]